MKANLLCPYCTTSFSVTLAWKNDSTYTVECPNGHGFESEILYHDFQKLFEIGVSTMAEGYYREALGSFTATYERFMELVIKIIMSVHRIDNNTFDATWKHVSRQSERQLGAFAFLFALEFAKPPPLLSEKLVALRNKVIHQGYFPTRSECLCYGQAVLDFARESLVLLFQSPPHKAELIRSINNKMNLGHPTPQVVCFPWHLIGTNRDPTADTKPLEQMVSEAEANRQSK